MYKNHIKASDIKIGKGHERRFSKNIIYNPVIVKFLIFMFFATIGYFYKPDQTMDLYRYYEFYENIDTNIGYFQFIYEAYSTNIDFIYFFSMFLSKKLGMGPNIVTAFFIGLFFNQLSVLFSSALKKEKLNLPTSAIVLVFLYATLSSPVVTTLSISRNMAALCFLLISFNALSYNKNYKKALIFSITAVFTHIISILFIFFSTLTNRLKLFRETDALSRNVALVIFCLLSFVFSKLLTFASVSFDFGGFGRFERYDVYLDSESDVYLSTFAVLAYQDVALILTSFAIFMFGLLRLKRYSGSDWISYYTVIMLSGTLGYSNAMTQRTLLFAIPLQGLLALRVLAQEYEMRRVSHAYHGILIAGVVVSLLNIYSYRYFLFLAN